MPFLIENKIQLVFSQLNQRKRKRIYLPEEFHELTQRKHVHRLLLVDKLLIPSPRNQCIVLDVATEPKEIENTELALIVMMFDYLHSAFE